MSSRTETKACRIATRALPKVRLMELRQVVKRSKKRLQHLLKGIKSPLHQNKGGQPFERRRMVPLEFEVWPGAETISVIAVIASAVCWGFYHLYCTQPTLAPLYFPLHLFFILISTLKRYQPVCYSQAEADDHRRPVGSAL